SVDISSGKADARIDTLKGEVTVVGATVSHAAAAPWTVYNVAADEIPPGAVAASESQGTIDPGQTTQLFSAFTNSRPADIRLTLSWPGSLAGLLVYRDGRPFRAATSMSPPLNVDLDGAGPGAWSFQVRDLDSGPAEPWFVIVSVVVPAQKQAVPFFNLGTCEHQVAAGGFDTWSVSALDAGGVPDLNARGLVSYSTFAAVGDGTGIITFSPPPAAGAEDVSLTVVASLGGGRATLSCVEHVLASSLPSSQGK